MNNNDKDRSGDNLSYKFEHKGFSVNIDITGPIPKEKNMYSVAKFIVSYDFLSHADEHLIPGMPIYYSSAEEAKVKGLEKVKELIDNYLRTEK